MTEQEASSLREAMGNAFRFKQGEILQLKDCQYSGARYQVLTRQVESSDSQIRLIYGCRASSYGIIQGAPIMVLEDELERIKDRRSGDR